MIAAVLSLAWAGLAPGPGITSVEAHAFRDLTVGSALHVEMEPHGSPVGVVELLPHQEPADADLTSFVWRGDGSEEDLGLSLYAGPRDRSYSRFLLVDAETGEPIGNPRAVTRLAGSAFQGGVPQPESIKGITCPVDAQDVINLGTDWVDFGVLLSVVVDWSGAEPERTWLVDGVEVGINMDYVRSLDELIKPFSDAGLRVILIPVNAVPTEPQPGNPMIHPRTNLAEAPNHLGAFNLTDREGYLHYRAAMEFLAHRYGDPGGEHGFVSGYVIGNELQSHWAWHNMGEATADEVVRDYVPALRVAWIACQKANPDISVYISLEHNWNTRIEASPLRGTTGRKILEGINDRVRAEGRFPWHVAYHPYPENLFDPKVWDDKAAVVGFDTPKITFRNLEVLPAYLRQDRFLRPSRVGLDLEPPRIILSEQGFHCPATEDGELLQAAAYAYAYERCLRIPEVEAFILHRHADHPMEGGLRLGLLSLPGEDGGPRRERLVYDVFGRADTPRREEAFAFALDVIGIESWDQVGPAAIVPKESGEVAPPIPATGVVADLIAMAPEAEWHDTMGWRMEWERAMDGLLWPTLFHHPPAEDAGRISTADFEIALPRIGAEERLSLQLGTLVTHPDSDGVRFSVVVDGDRLWSQETRPADPPRQHAVDLGSYAGRSVTLTLEVDAIGHTAGDWANWVRPVVLRLPAD
ncbi:MAG: hypothetical protein GF320_03080 [Armatimonadia bacterium]|nr:hypothetical protein [Armatimonadia bacterium]